MEFGFYLPTRGPLGTPEHMTALAAKGEELGYGYIAVTDHVVVPRGVDSRYPYTDEGDWPAGRFGDFCDQLTVLAYLAGRTGSARLLTSVMVAPHRPPVLAAKMLSTIDILSRGRLTVGVGAGWCKEEFEAIGAPPHKERGKVTDEYIRVFRELWSAEDPEFHGDYADFADIAFLPRPVQQPGPPVWIGGESRPALRRVVRLGDGWLPIAHNPNFPLDTRDRYEAALDGLARLAGEAGRRIDDVDRAFFIMRWGSEPGDPLPPLGTDGPATDGNRRLMTGSAEQMAADVAALEGLGVKVLVLNFERPGLSETMDGMEAFARDVGPLAAPAADGRAGRGA